MKKIYMLIAIAMFGYLAVNAQMAKSGTGIVGTRLNPKFNSHSVARNNPTGINHTNAIKIWYDDFSNLANWSTTHTEGTSDWLIQPAGPSGPNPIGIIQSETSANNFALFDSDAYCDSLHGQVADITTVNPIDLTGHSNVRLHFSQYYKRFFDSTFVFISINNTNWTKYEVNQSFANNAQTLNNPDIQYIDISSVAGNQSTVYVRFEFYSDTALSSSAGCGYAWMIDDVSIDDIPAVDALIPSYYSGDPLIYPGEYTVIPIIQPEAFQIKGRIYNNGSTPITGAKIMFDVTDEFTLTSVYTDSSAATGTLNPGDTSALMSAVNNPFCTVPAISNYSFTQRVVLPSIYTDGDIINDTVSAPITVTDSIYARDVASIGGNLGPFSFGFNAPNAGYMGQIFHIYHLSDITSGSFFLENPTIGDSVRIAVFSVSGGVPTNVIIGSSDYYVTTSNDSMNSVFLTLPLLNTIHAAPGDYFMAVQQVTAGGFFTLASSEKIFTPHRVFAKTTAGTTWTPFENIGNDFRVALIISLNNPSGSLNGVTELQKSSAFNVYPNPSTGIISVSFNGNVEKNVTLNVVDEVGQVVKSTHYESFSSSQINLSSLPAGVYTLNIRTNSGEENKVIVLK